jgi:hypothetical protein
MNLNRLRHSLKHGVAALFVLMVVVQFAGIEHNLEHIKSPADAQVELQLCSGVHSPSIAASQAWLFPLVAIATETLAGAFVYDQYQNAGLSHTLPRGPPAHLYI